MSPLWGVFKTTISLKCIHYVKENPVDVLRCLWPEELTLMDNTPHIYNVISNPIDYSTEKTMKTPLDSVLFEVSSKCREIITYINKWSKGNKLRGMSFKELDCLSDSLFDYEDELDEYEGKLTSLIAATPQGFAARQEDIDYLMTVVGHVRHTIINMQEAVDKTIEITTSDDEEEYFAPDDKAQLEKLFNCLHQASRQIPSLEGVLLRHKAAAPPYLRGDPPYG